MAFSMNPNNQQCCTSLQNLLDMISASGGLVAPQIPQMASIIPNDLQYQRQLLQQQQMCPMGIGPYNGGTFPGLPGPSMTPFHPGFSHAPPQMLPTTSFTPMQSNPLHQLQGLRAFNHLPGIQSLPCIQQNPAFDLRNCPRLQRQEEIRQTPKLPVPKKKSAVKPVENQVLTRPFGTPPMQVLPGTPILPAGPSNKPATVTQNHITATPIAQPLSSNVQTALSAFKAPIVKAVDDKSKDQQQMLPTTTTKAQEVPTIQPRPIAASKPPPPKPIKNEDEDPSDDFKMGQILAKPYFPTHFMKGTMYNLSGIQKKVEDLNSDDFLKCVRYSKEFHVEVAPVREIVKGKDAAKVKFIVGLPKPYETWLEVRIEYPFFVIGKGWSSIDPYRTLSTYGLNARALQLKDICITLTPKTERFCARQVDLLVSLAEAHRFREKQHQHAIWSAQLARQVSERDADSGRTSVPPGASVDERSNSRKRRASEHWTPLHSHRI